jgi:hypothetical protein
VSVLIAVVLLAFGVAAETVTLNSDADAVAVSVVVADGARTVIEYEFGSFTRNPVDIDGDTYYEITVGTEGRMLERGLPGLPVVARSIIIPDDAAMDVRVLGTSYVDFEDVPVAPSKGVITRNIDPATVSYDFDPFYQTDRWFPGKVVHTREPYIMRDVRGLTVVLNPVQYNPATKTLRVYTSVIVEVYSTGSGRINVLQHSPNESAVAEFERIYARHFLNYRDVRSDRYASVGEMGNMLVISYGSFMTAMEPLVEWKKQMGIPCEMVSVTDAGSTANGIRNYIQNYYDTNGLAFVLLVGDAAQVPSLSASGGSSDPSYSLVAGSDSYPDLFVGRFSAETVEQVETQVLRSVEYEKYPQSAGAWYHKGMGIASNQGPGDDGEYDNVHIDNIRADLLGFTYTEVDRIYDPSGTASMVTNGLNDGRSVINYCGHGSAYSWGSTGFSTSNVNALTNDNMLPFIISVACVNGQFAGITCFAEAWLRATHGSEPTGAIGAYMSSIDQSWNPPMDGQDEVADLLVAEEKRTFGGLCFNGSCKMMDTYGTDGANMFKTWTVFGDPSLRVSTDTPTPLTVGHDSDIDSGAGTFDVEVTGVEGALCALYYDDVLYGSALTNASGDATISISGALGEGNDLVLTVTSFNATPYFGTVTVGPSYTPIVDVSPASFDVTLEPGETTSRTLYISNIGEALSVLNYQIDIVDGGSARDLTGSTVTSDPTEYTPGTTVDIVFSAYNGSSDSERMEAVTLDFPTGVTVNTCTNFSPTISSRELVWDGTTGNGASVSWIGDYSNVIYPYERAFATVNVTIDSGFSGDLEIDFALTGNDYGSPPHAVSGTITLSGPPGPTVTLTVPNGGEEWGIGNPHEIIWTWSGAFSAVALSYSTDNGASWYDIIGTTPNDGSHTWTITADASDECLVKVVGETVPPIEDVSDALFSVFVPVDWLAVVPASGFVNASETADIELQFNAEGMSEGDYYADLLIDSNGGARVVVPVTLHVESTGIIDVPATLLLYGNHPNPFNPMTEIAFAMPGAGHVRVSVFDVSGRLVKVVADGEYEAGLNQVMWDGTNSAGAAVASGVYVYRLEVGDESLEARMVLLK